MGQGGYLSLINATPFSWHKIYEHSYQMNSWDFPDVINPGEQLHDTLTPHSRYGIDRFV
jgi:hypothetical protein